MRHIWVRHSSAASSFPLAFPSPFAVSLRASCRLSPLTSLLTRATPTSAPASPRLSRAGLPAFAVAYTISGTKRGFHTTKAAASPSVEDMETVNTTARLAAVRSLMKENGVDIYSMACIHA